MSTLTEFLLARIAEDEVKIHGDWSEGRGMHIITEEMHGRMLAECEAKRRIVAEHGPLRFYGPDRPLRCTTCAVWEEDDYDGPPSVDYPCLTLRALALPYADHPDYRDVCPEDDPWALLPADHPDRPRQCSGCGTKWVDEESARNCERRHHGD